MKQIWETCSDRKFSRAVQGVFSGVHPSKWLVDCTFGWSSIGEKYRYDKCGDRNERFGVKIRGFGGERWHGKTRSTVFGGCRSFRGRTVVQPVGT